MCSSLPASWWRCAICKCCFVMIWDYVLRYFSSSVNVLASFKISSSHRRNLFALYVFTIFTKYGALGLHDGMSNSAFPTPSIMASAAILVWSNRHLLPMSFMCQYSRRPCKDDNSDASFLLQ